MTEPSQDLKLSQDAKPNQKPITTAQIALGVAGGLFLFILAGLCIKIFIDFLGLFGDHSGNVGEALRQSENDSRELEEYLDSITMDCAKSLCAVVDGSNLVKWPLSVHPPVTVTCNTSTSRKYIQASGRWFERTDKPRLNHPSWLEIQKVEGLWPFQHRVSLMFLKEEIDKVCKG
jgi:hypothetical protein